MAAEAYGGLNNSETADPAARYRQLISQRIQILLDKSTPHPVPRWAASACFFLLYLIRVWFLRGFYIVTYGLGIYNLNLAIGFLTPAHLQWIPPDESADGPSLPTKADQEFRPFVRRLPEFKFWYAATRSIAIALGMTFFRLFDVPVFWPILLVYWFILVGITARRQIQHMVRYKYLPFDWGKKTYAGANGGGAGPRAKGGD